jgi:hypothetical protein
MKRALNIIHILLFVFLSNLTLAQNELKAILIVGHQENRTQSAIEKMDSIGSIFTERGVTVYKFYDKAANWDSITEVAKNCNFFVYSGHGSNKGENGGAGGIMVNSLVSTSDMLESLRLRENALVVFISVCNGAGSSAGDNGDIGITEAKKRVISYSNPFFKIGASAYYASNNESASFLFLKKFLSGIDLKKSYIRSTNFFINEKLEELVESGKLTITEVNSKTEIEFDDQFPMDKSKNISITSNSKISSKGYNITYVGNPNFSLSDMKSK